MGNQEEAKANHSKDRILLLIFLLTGLAWWVGIPQTSWAAQVAVVKKDRATVYADQEMTSPIGYVRMGKKLRVGEVARSHGQVLPLVVSGKIAWIATDDLYLEEDIMELKDKKFAHHKAMVEDLEQEKLKYKKKFFHAEYGWFMASGDWKGTSTVVNNTERQAYGTSVDLRFGGPFKLGETTGFRFGANYMFINDHAMKFRAWGVAGDLTKVLYDNLKYFIEGVVTLGVSPYAQMEILLDRESGRVATAKFSIDTTYHISEDLSAKVDLGYSIHQLMSFEINGGRSIEAAQLNGSIYGLELRFGLVYRL